MMNLLKENRKWDIYLLQRQNATLIKKVKGYEHGGNFAP